MAIKNGQPSEGRENAHAAPAIPIIPTLDHNRPLFLQPTDSPSSSLISLQLTRSDNYVLVSRSMRICLLGKS